MGLVGITAVNGAEGCAARLFSSLSSRRALRLHDKAAKAVRAHVISTRLTFFRRGFHDVRINGARAEKLDEQGGDGSFIHATMLPDPRSARQHPCLYRKDSVIRAFVIAVTKKPCRSHL